MAGVALGAALRHIQRLFSDGTTTGFSDTQLLSRFAEGRDEAAFAAILARHGPMVLAVCRGILRDPWDAEDAFQATFLVLARKAGSAWTEGRLGGWLHKVAYRVAVRASADAARRQRHERRVAETAAVESTDAELIDDLRPALHDELARLPAKFRLPVVLCYLEGLTHAQAAVELHCGEATLRRRLVEARERLRARLTIRGFVPADSALGLILAREAGSAVPPLCTEATIRAVKCLATGEAMATVVGARVASLTQGRFVMMTTGWKTTAAIVISVVALACLAAGIGAASGKVAATSPQDRTLSVMAPAAQPAHAPVDQQAKPARRHAIKGLVLSPDGKPVSTATVYWLGLPRSEQRNLPMPRGQKEKPESREKMLARGMTNPRGRFELTADFDGEGYPARTVIVKAAGAGLLGRTFMSETVKEGSGADPRLTFRLRPTATIEGQLLTPAGAAAVGVKVLLEEFHDKDNEREGDGVSCGDISQDYEPQFDFWPSLWTTDNSGRFRIEGIVPERMFARIHFRHSDFADDSVLVSTGAPFSDSPRAFNVKPVAAKFTHTLEPARPVTGVVTDQETGKPLAGVVIEACSVGMRNRSLISARTDASGRYRVAGASGDSFWVVAYPDPASGYLPVRKDWDEWPAGAKVLEMNLALPRPPGSILRGRIVEAGSSRPVAGASVVYEPGLDNPHNDDQYDFDNPVLTDGDGNFALSVLPGAGLLAVEAPTPEFIRVPLTGPRSNGGSFSRTHGFARLDLPAGTDKDNPPRADHAAQRGQARSAPRRARRASGGGDGHGLVCRNHGQPASSPASSFDFSWWLRRRPVPARRS